MEHDVGHWNLPLGIVEDVLGPALVPEASSRRPQKGKLVPNERLRGAIASSGFTPDDVAREVGVDAKTVQRWITKNRTPYRSHRRKVAAMVGTKETHLWPDTASDARTKSASRAELIDFFPSRSAVPVDLWVSLIEDATESFDLMAFASLFLPEHVELSPRLCRRAAEGVRVRVLLGNPDSEAVRIRGEEEGLSGGMAHRIRLSLRYLEECERVPGIDIRLHSTTLYASIFRADNVALVNAHVYGAPAAQSPVLHLQQMPDGRVFDYYMRSFDRVWQSAKPVSDSFSSGERQHKGLDHGTS